MTFFKKTADEQSLRDVLSLDKAERKRREALQRDLDAVRPQWEALQEKAELLAARYGATGSVYERSVCEPWWREVDSRLKGQIAEIVKQRDGLTAPLVAQIAEIGKRIHKRHGILTGAFGSWASLINDQLPGSLGIEILQARREVEASQDLSEIVKKFEQWIARVGDLDELPTTLPLPNLAHVIRQLAAATLPEAPAA